MQESSMNANHQAPEPPDVSHFHENRCRFPLDQLEPYAGLVVAMGPVADAGHLDSAADDTVFPEAVAIAVGIDLTNAPIGEAAGVGSGPVQVRYAQVTLRVAGNGERREWVAWVGFTAARLN